MAFLVTLRLVHSEPNSSDVDQGVSSFVQQHQLVVKNGFELPENSAKVKCSIPVILIEMCYFCELTLL